MVKKWRDIVHKGKPAPITGQELNRRMRVILLAATPETVLSSSMALTELGFTPYLSYRLVEQVLDAKAKGLYPA